MRRFTFKRFAKAALVRGVGREISAHNRKQRSRKLKEEKEIAPQVLNEINNRESTIPVDPFKSKRQAIHGQTITILTRKDGGVNCTVCGSDMGQPRERGLFHKHFEYQCPNCGIIAEIKN